MPVVELVGHSEPKEQNQFSHRSMANLANVKVFRAEGGSGTAEVHPFLPMRVVANFTTWNGSRKRKVGFSAEKNA